MKGKRLTEDYVEMEKGGNGKGLRGGIKLEGLVAHHIRPKFMFIWPTRKCILSNSECSLHAR